MSLLTAPLDTLTLTQLFTRQAMINAEYERALAARNQHPTISAEWDLWNAVLTGSMQDLADVAREITRRITQAAADHENEPLTHVPMACTTCGQPVTNAGPGIWHHVPRNDDCQVVRLGGIIKARVDA